MPSDLSLSQMLLRVLAAVVISGLHGFLFALMARLLGDKGATYDGRLTLNPFVHLDLLGLVSMVFSRAGWIRPVQLEARQFRGGIAGLLACVLVPLIGLLAFAVLLVRLRGLPMQFLDPGASQLSVTALSIVAECAVWYAVLNLIPIPPLAAGSLLLALMPRIAQVVMRNVLWSGLVLTALMILTGGNWLAPAAGPLARLLLG